MPAPLSKDNSYHLNARHIAAWLVFITVLLTYSSFPQPESPNSTSRLGWVLNLVQNGDPSLAGFSDFTIDKSVFDGKFYSDKAPGLSLAALPILSIITYFKTIAPTDFGSAHWAFTRYLATLSTVGVLSAFTASLIFRTGLKRTGNVSAALFSSALFSIGSPIFGWSTLLFGHAAVASLFILTMIAAEHYSTKNSWFHAGGAAAVLLGVTANIEYTSVIPGAIIAMFVINRILRSHHTKFYQFKSISTMLMLGVAMLTPALIYNWVCFGNPLRVGYGYVAGFESMKSGFYGLGVPDPIIAVELLFGTYRGLIWICPAIIVMALAVIYGLRQNDTRGLALLSLAIFCYYLALNSAYAYWNGGFSTGPRHLLPAIGLPILLIARVWDAFSTPTKILSVILLVQSVIINLAATSILMMAPYWLDNPILGYILPYFFQHPEWRSLALVTLWLTVWLALIEINRMRTTPPFIR